MVQLTLAVKDYACEDCYRERGLVVQALVQMMPRSAIVFGELVGEVWWGCPVCHREKFPVKKRTARRRKVECESTG